ncbi:hypothetical protein NYZ99_02930 [Maribacter litopenaei]|uniref:Uncharacterized protein n=1 Tax=Maribacter litopenaei TaxID=2976127 RepID=A0ABY5Y9H5_9FLAO|nr:hypothetical protein [Maribacter litopenaei]UWX55491.1 hypothetical protein NYZ99_02930 [Maribacter litopenaei]
MERHNFGMDNPYRAYSRKLAWSYTEVHRWAYDYSKVDENDEYIIPGQDYVQQHVPLFDGEEELQH